MASFGSLQTALSGLSASRAAMDVIGQNIANLGTEGYTRQRVSLSGVEAVRGASGLSGVPRAGGGVSVDSIIRIDNALLDARVRDTASETGFWSTRSAALGRLEATLREPGTEGISASLDEFWAAWQDLANHPGATSESSVLLEATGALTSKIATGYRAAESEWTRVRAEAAALVGDVNRTAERLAALNDEIRQLNATGSTAAELVDQRDLLATDLARSVGGVLRRRDDGMVDVLLDGNALVSGTHASAITLTGANAMTGAASDPVRIEWQGKPGRSVPLAGGELSALTGLLAAPDGNGNGGAIAETAAAYDALARSLHDRVNAVHTTGATASGETGRPFFSLPATGSAALGLRVVPTDASGIASAAAGTGAGNGANADAIARLDSLVDGPDATWTALVVRTGVLTRVARQEATSADASNVAAVAAQRSSAGVDLDEETTNLLMFQHAYQGAARVLSAIDEALDTLINRTGLVGR